MASTVPEGYLAKIRVWSPEGGLLEMTPELRAR